MAFERLERNAPKGARCVLMGARVGNNPGLPDLHPEHILGNLEIVPIYDRLGLTCKRTGNPFTLLQKMLKVLMQEKLTALIEEKTRLESHRKVLHSSVSILLEKLEELQSSLAKAK